MDWIDEAQGLEEHLRGEALYRFKTALMPEEAPWRDPERGTVICLDCDAPIPAARLRAHPRAVRCIECQRDYDHAQRLEARLYEASEFSWSG